MYQYMWVIYLNLLVISLYFKLFFVVYFFLILKEFLRFRRGVVKYYFYVTLIELNFIMNIVIRIKIKKLTKKII